MGQEDYLIPYDKVREAVWMMLKRPGRPIDAIKAARKHGGDVSERKLRNDKVWHHMRELKEFVAKELKLDIDAVLGPRRKSNRFTNMVTQEIVRLRGNGTLRDWQKGSQLGVWRTVKDLPTPSSNLVMSAKSGIWAARGDTKPADKNEMRRVFLSILQKQRKDNTYKFALARAILEYCHQARDKVRPNYTIEYKYLARKFLQYYWRQEYFKIKQDFHTKKSPKVITIIRDAFDGRWPESFGILKGSHPDKVRQAESEILQDLFGRHRGKTSIVVPTFQNIQKGRSVLPNPIFYEHDDDEQALQLKPAAFDFFRENYQTLSYVVLGEWTKYLENANSRMPKLMTKLEAIKTARLPMMRFRASLENHFDHCFYCGSRLELHYTDVDHFIPWSFIFENDWWNLVLACKECNCKKSASLAEDEFLDCVIERNEKYRDRIGELGKSLDRLKVLDGDWDAGIKNRYNACIECGFTKIRMP